MTFLSFEAPLLRNEMLDENEINENLSKLEITKLRKERKLLKKTLKREQRQKETDKKQWELKLGSKDQHVTIISKNIADKLKAPREYCVCNNENLDLSRDNNFPALISTVTKFNRKQIKTNSEISMPTTSKNVTEKQNKRNNVTINLVDILTKPKTEIAQKLIPTNQICKYDGNILDASKPKRYKGKHREASKPKAPTKLKAQIIADVKQNDIDKTINFCDNVITEELNTNVKEFLSYIVRFQENLYKRDPIKGSGRRRYVTGFREVKKYLLINKIKFLILAPNFKNFVENGALDYVLHELISLASKNNVPHVYALSRRKIGQITLKHIPVSCVGVFYYDGAEQLFSNILQLLENLKIPTASDIQQLQENEDIGAKIREILC